MATLVVAVGCGGGGDDGPSIEETRADALAACYVWSDSVLQQWSPCLEWTAEQLADELAEGRANCDSEVAAQVDSCVDEQLEAFEGCGDTYSTSHTCEALCPEGFCYAPCSYFCHED